MICKSTVNDEPIDDLSEKEAIPEAETQSSDFDSDFESINLWKKKKVKKEINNLTAFQ
ncbi:unnamed protein product [Ceutorhynchus assimilis]|uniref:Uncharacterized protein n=1 Tax=Ceutorhynchus assimilis TaxID=467358 RepID=A0A9N9MRQ1_9CUCU|nr:unnamed protein product [Ceutorhynchus assimilis]